MKKLIKGIKTRAALYVSYSETFVNKPRKELRRIEQDRKKVHIDAQGFTFEK